MLWRGGGSQLRRDSSSQAAGEKPRNAAPASDSVKQPTQGSGSVKRTAIVDLRDAGQWSQLRLDLLVVLRLADDLEPHADEPNGQVARALSLAQAADQRDSLSGEIDRAGAEQAVGAKEQRIQECPGHGDHSARGDS